MKENKILVKVYMDDDLLTLETTTEKIVEGKLYPAGDGRIGVVLRDSKKYLGVTKDAVPVLEDLFRRAGCDGDGFGDIDWYESGNVFCFGWLGPNKIQWDPTTFEEADRAVDAYFRKGEYRSI